MEQIFKPYLGSGKIYARVHGSTMPLAEIGNVSELKLSITEDVKEMQDFTHAGGGAYAKVTRIKSVDTSITLHDLNATNIARAVFGDTAAVIGGSILDEPHTAYKGGLIRLMHPAPSAVVLTGAGATPPTYVAGTDYEVRPEGIYILPTSTIVDATSVLVDYTYVGYNAIEALTKSSVDLELSFGGINEADSGNPVIVDLFKVNLGAAKDISLIGTDFASLQVSGSVLVDPNKTGTGISRFFKVQQV